MDGQYRCVGRGSASSDLAVNMPHFGADDAKAMFGMRSPWCDDPRSKRMPRHHVRPHCNRGHVHCSCEPSGTSGSYYRPPLSRSPISASVGSENADTVECGVAASISPRAGTAELSADVPRSRDVCSLAGGQPGLACSGVRDEFLHIWPLSVRPTSAC